MKKTILITLILLSSIMMGNAQWNGTNPVWTNSNVGIGTGYGGVGVISPVEKLTIGEMGGNFAVQDRRTSLTEKYSSGYKFYDYTGESASVLLEHNGYFGSSARALKFSVDGNERVRINSSGYMGIGTTAPDEKLTVKGKIHTQEVRVDMSGPLVPDYVFSNNYKLKTLQEVEAYIKQNSHLPEIPSAKEIEKNGLMLAEMNMALLKKIEEMTLYMIEQNKRIEKLEKKNIKK